MTSDKMAACLISSDKGDDISKISRILEGKIVGLLTKVEYDNVQETGKTICASYTKAALLDFRRKLFAVACKAEKESDKGEINQRDALTIDKDECAQKEKTPVLANRKSKQPVVDDCIALALHIKNPTGTFPQQVLKSKTVERSKKNSQTTNSDKSGGECDSGSSSSEQEEESDCETNKEPIGVQKHFERFVIRELCSERPDDEATQEENWGDIPVAVTALRECSTQTDTPYPGPSIIELRDSGSFDLESDDEMSRKRTVMERDSTMDMSKCKVRENDVEEIRRKCDRVERRINSIEYEHAKEMGILRAEHSAIKDDLAAVDRKIGMQVGNGSKACDKSGKIGKQKRDTRVKEPSQRKVVIDRSWETDESTMLVLTQDSQGEPVMTRATPLHDVEGVVWNTLGSATKRIAELRHSDAASVAKVAMPQHRL